MNASKSLMFLAGFLILAGIIVAIVLLTSSTSSDGSSPSPDPDPDPEWVAVGWDGTSYGNIMYSENGKNWTRTTSGDSFSDFGSGVAYGTSDEASPLWVAVGDGDDDGNKYGNIMYSENGKNWTRTTSGDSFSIRGKGVAYGTSDGASPLWVAVGEDGLSGGYGTIMYSENGKNWTKTSSGDSFTGSDAYGNGVAYGTSDGASPLWVAVGNDGTSYGSIMYSSNGKTWTKTTSGDSFSGSGALGYGVAFDQVLYGVCTTNYHP